MSDPADVGFLLGYGSFCEIGLRYGTEAGSLAGGEASKTVRVPLLNASYDRARNVPTQGIFNTQLNESKGGRFRTGVGVYSYSGNLSFEMTDELRNLFFQEDYGFFQRRSFLDIKLCDGEGQIYIPGAVWSSFSLNGDVGAAINGSISFSSCNGYEFDIEVGSPAPSESYDTFPELEPYWTYGGEGVQSFSLTFNRTVTPCYLNESVWVGPTYLRVGLMDVSFAITCWEKWFEHNSLVLGNKVLHFTNKSFLSQKSYQFAGMSGEGMKTYTNNSTSIRGDGDLFTLGTI